MGILWGMLAALGVLVISFSSMILVVFELSGLSFILSVLLFAGLIVFATLALSGTARKKAWGWSFLSFLSIMFVLYVLFVYLVAGSLENLTTLIASSIILLVISIINFRLAVEPRQGIGLIVPKVEVYESLEKMEPREGKAAKNVKASFTPGKFIGSKFGGTIHRPTCEWAKKVRKGNRQWFSSVEEANKAGMKPHSCIG